MCISSGTYLFLLTFRSTALLAVEWTLLMAAKSSLRTHTCSGSMLCIAFTLWFLHTRLPKDSLTSARHLQLWLMRTQHMCQVTLVKSLCWFTWVSHSPWKSSACLTSQWTKQLLTCGNTCSCSNTAQISTSENAQMVLTLARSLDKKLAVSRNAFVVSSAQQWFWPLWLVRLFSSQAWEEQQCSTQLTPLSLSSGLKLIKLHLLKTMSSSSKQFNRFHTNCTATTLLASTKSQTISMKGSRTSQRPNSLKKIKSKSQFQTTPPEMPGPPPKVCGQQLKSQCV